MNHLEPSGFGGTIGGVDYQAHYSQAAPAHYQPFDMAHAASDGREPASAFCSACGIQNVSNMERVLSVAAGLGLAALGLKRRRVSGLLLAGAGASLVWRGVSGNCAGYSALGINTAEHNPATAVPAQEGFKVERTMIVDRAPSELYQFWRRLDNLPQVMRHLKYVESMDSFRSHWKAEGAFGVDVEWDAEIYNERENEMIAWRSLPGGDVETAGSVHFTPLGNGATEMSLSMKYNPPAGKIGAQIASIFGQGLEAKLDEDLRRFKEVMETGLPAAPDIEAMESTPFSESGSHIREQFT